MIKTKHATKTTTSKGAKLVRWSLAAAFLVGGPLFAVAHHPDGSKHNSKDPYEEISNGDVAKKRAKNTGKGMPSILGPFPANNLDFVGQLTNAELGVSRLVFTGTSFLSDIWGWTSPDSGDEYALVGTSSGVAFARIEDPANPEFLGIIPTTNTGTTRNFWWDLKTYDNHVYITTEVNFAGIAIFNLLRLDSLSAVDPEAPEAILVADARYDENGVDDGYVRAHNISINEATGFAYVTGASMLADKHPDFVDDGMIVLDLKDDPLNPKLVGWLTGLDTHDAQVVTYSGPDPDGYVDGASKEVAFVFNGTDLNMGIYDVTTKGFINVVDDDSSTFSESFYDGPGFTHQGWLDEDQAFLFMGDEEDEVFGISQPKNPDLPDNTKTFIWDVRDLNLPTVINTFEADTASIDHNMFVKGDYVYQANYTSGIRVLKIERDGDVDINLPGSGMVSLCEVGVMDTEPRLPTNHMNNNINIFIGPWGIFPFFDSGTIAVSDGVNGLVLAKISDGADCAS